MSTYNWTSQFFLQRQILQQSYSIQIIEVLSGNGHDESGILDEIIRRLRLVSEDFWMKILRTNFPYWLNKRIKRLIPAAPTSSNVHPIGRSGERNSRCHKNRNSRYSKVSLRNCLIFFKARISSKLKMIFSEFRKYKNMKILVKKDSKRNSAFLSWETSWTRLQGTISSVVQFCIKHYWYTAF